MNNGLIVVGIDGSESSRDALHWALGEARLRGAPLRVVHAWDPTPEFLPEAPLLAADYETLRRSASEYVDTLVAETIGAPDDVDVTAVAARGPAARALVEAATGAGLLVVGSRGHGGFAGLLLGSVSQQCVQHAPCPVVIVRRAGS
jgi:nucleotide-binding universal stress UspA family protein